MAARKTRINKTASSLQPFATTKLAAAHINEAASFRPPFLVIAFAVASSGEICPRVDHLGSLIFGYWLFVICRQSHAFRQQVIAFRQIVLALLQQVLSLSHCQRLLAFRWQLFAFIPKQLVFSLGALIWIF